MIFENPNCLTWDSLQEPKWLVDTITFRNQISVTEHPQISVYIGRRVGQWLLQMGYRLWLCHGDKASFCGWQRLMHAHKYRQTIDNNFSVSLCVTQPTPCPSKKWTVEGIPVMMWMKLNNILNLRNVICQGVQF